ncbi:MAG: hypothetical protein HN347_17090 [Bacteroidetes bacterium]|nr:hypothetical protein [Bacteroidota bacterium]MBT7142971.1 hypothetical protein [Bacteroidota bacterium]
MKAIHNTNIYPEQSIITVFNISKIQNESNSQLELDQIIFDGTVFNISKIQNESNSQQYVESAVTEADCVQYFKDTK